MTNILLQVEGKNKGIPIKLLAYYLLIEKFSLMFWK